jgi:hypothetical protein
VIKANIIAVLALKIPDKLANLIFFKAIHRLNPLKIYHLIALLVGLADIKSNKKTSKIPKCIPFPKFQHNTLL